MDTISLRVDFKVPTLVSTKNGQKLASGFELKRIVLPGLIGTNDYKTLFSKNPEKLLEMCLPEIMKKLQEEAAGWSVTFCGYTLMTHHWGYTPDEDHPDWI